ncbi:hypothetical protein DL96DRAFT_1705361 [Flagelloscypha sp. PMI_526]|nr:hypothetical protein DL96DRAFT_1705361 [Flagelloscypha sp. PMI_526]
MRFIILAALLSFAMATPVPNPEANPDSAVDFVNKVELWLREPVANPEANPDSIVDRENDNPDWW